MVLFPSRSKKKEEKKVIHIKDIVGLQTPEAKMISFHQVLLNAKINK